MIVLGHDYYGEPLRVGDRVQVLRAPGCPRAVGLTAVVLGPDPWPERREPGKVEIRCAESPADPVINPAHLRRMPPDQSQASWEDVAADTGWSPERRRQELLA